MSYDIHIKSSAERDMDALKGVIYERILQRILKLKENPRPRGCKKLSGKDEYRLRVGNYRILYAIDDKNLKVEIVAEGHRRDVYRGKEKQMGFSIQVA